MELKLEQYLLAFASWRKSKLQAIDRKTRKLVATYGALQSKSDADRLYRPRKEGGRGLISIEACFELAIRGLEVFFFFLSGFSFTNIHNSQNSRGREKVSV